MNKLFSLIKTCLKDNMSIFKIKSKSKRDKYLPWFLAIALMFSFYANAELLMEPLAEVHMEFVVITMFILGTTVMTFMEGIYKSSGLLFNCKDDSLLLALPIKKSTVFFIRILKFYIFELIFNSLFLIPSIVCYAVHVNPGIGYYFISLIAILLLPIIPVVLSTIFGIVISYLSSKFKRKRIVQTIITFIFVFIIMIISFRLDKFMDNIVAHAKTINDIVTGIYYPAGLYINMITNFKIIDLVLFLVFNILPFVILVLALKDVYFKINSNIKIVKRTSSHNKNQEYKVKSLSKQKSFIKKEIKRLVNTPVYIINSCFGLFIYLGLIIFLVVKPEFINDLITYEGEGPIFELYKYLPLILLGFIIFDSLMSSLTCCMISLEGKSFNTLKSLPLRPIDIIMYKVNTVLVIEVPIMLLGVLLTVIRFRFSLLIVLLLIINGIVFPFISGLFGIIINLKFPKLDAKDDTEVVKQSMSSFVAVMGGMLLGISSIALMVKLCDYISNQSLIALIITVLGICIASVLYFYAKKFSTKDFNKLTV